tara:strand:- start:236387 stop:236974 length:588 start_codon:yes stop_codon:yes gene_type:complete
LFPVGNHLSPWEFSASVFGGPDAGDLSVKIQRDKTVITLGRTDDLNADADKLRRWRCGRIVMQNGRLVEVQHRLLCGNVSVAQVWWQASYGRSDESVCWLDYHQPLGMPAFLTLDYIRSGKQAGYKTFIGAVKVLEQIAKIRQSVAIVAHVTNGNISDRFLSRIGWQQHMPNWKGRHWIRRFYDGYPDDHLHRYA